MIAYDKRGVVFALTEGAELLLHDGESEGPLWRKTLDGSIVGLGIDSEQVVAVTETGTVIAFAARTGETRGTQAIGARVMRACVDVGVDRVVAITETKIIQLLAGAHKVLAEHGAQVLAMSPDGTVLAATDTELVLLDGARRTRALAGVKALAYHPQGFWVLGMQAKLLRWDGNSEPSHITNLPPGSKLEQVACSERALGIVWDRHMCVALEWPSRETLGSLQYLERTIEGIDFGPWPWLGVGLDLGDGNKFHLEDARLHRSDTHPGRQHHSWLVSVGGPAKAEPARPSAPPAPTKPVRGSGNPLGLVLLAIAVVLVLFLVVR